MSQSDDSTQLDIIEINMRQCSGWSLPVIIFVIIMLINVASLLFFIPTFIENKGNKNISSGTKAGYIILAVAVYLIFAFLFGYWLYRLSANCEEGFAWVLLLLAFIFPVLPWIIVLLLIGLIILL